jgi:hypothetical protein
MRGFSQKDKSDERCYEMSDMIGCHDYFCLMKIVFMDMRERK